MLILRDVTITHDKSLILQNCSMCIPSRSIIVSTNKINTKDLLKYFSGTQPIDNGVINLDIETVKNQESLKKPFFIIPSNLEHMWHNYELKDVFKLLKIKSMNSTLLDKYNIPTNKKFQLLTEFQKIIFLVSIGKILKRSIFIFDNPQKKLDYLDNEQFLSFLYSDFKNQDYLIFSNRFGESIDRNKHNIFALNLELRSLDEILFN